MQIFNMWYKRASEKGYGDNNICHTLLLALALATHHSVTTQSPLKNAFLLQVPLCPRRRFLIHVTPPPIRTGEGLVRHIRARSKGLCRCLWRALIAIWGIWELSCPNFRGGSRCTTKTRKERTRVVSLQLQR
jgi:hypothetical protein